MKIEITKILAIGTYERYAWIKIEKETICIRIPNSLYKKLREKKVPTSQSLRKKGDKK